jgi:hypothetical protein
LIKPAGNPAKNEKGELFLMVNRPIIRSWRIEFVN